ncbi:hypothetical protein JIN86_07545 [Lysinibacillus sp. HST-98]|uniref:hypothetical protein n=1 Tax=Lysinibacillus sp. HST-98 TaxID=2800419 RepID=UPI0001DA5B95|nr:hypothetical protein [Lysinibacillus sp. HST-98]EFI66494.1 hypothetical protein BFZC1_19958 [Lysinibacillus fusiformis ZC1]MBL3729454.1 hypothetical protein [Lysinibacillus sp. HST-98]
MKQYGYTRVSSRNQNIDRLGRNYEEILAQWRYLTTVKQIDGFYVIGYPSAGTGD